MLGLTPLGILHTGISLVAVATGLRCLIRDKAISMRTLAGRVYVGATVATCITALGIFQHGGFGKPHALAILTLITLTLAVLAERQRVFRTLSCYVEVVAYSATFLFHMVPALTETFTRLPAGAPVFSSPDDPALARVIGLCALGFAVVSLLQVLRLRSSRDVVRRA